jgi:hypothetical protein
MKRIVSKVVGAVFIAAAVLKWATYEYPDALPSVFTLGPMIGQVGNWLIVCILGAVGLALWNFDRSRT